MRFETLDIADNHEAQKEALKRLTAKDAPQAVYLFRQRFLVTKKESKIISDLGDAGWHFDRHVNPDLAIFYSPFHDGTAHDEHGCVVRDLNKFLHPQHSASL